LRNEFTTTPWASRVRTLFQWAVLTTVASLSAQAWACKGGTFADLVFLRGQTKLTIEQEVELTDALSKANRGLSYGSVLVAFAVYTPTTEASDLVQRERLTALRESEIKRWLLALQVPESQIERPVRSNSSAIGEMVATGAKAEVEFSFACKGM
jgi:hypothetical protein